MDNIELEARFLEIDVPSLQTTLLSLGASDWGENVIKDTIFYDKELTWKQTRKFVRLRQTKKETTLTFKHKEEQHSLGTKEIEFVVSSVEKAKDFLEAIGLIAFREQEKRRHTYMLDDVFLDIDYWPTIPPYLEIEGASEEKIKKTAEKLGLNWEQKILAGPGYIIEKLYNIPVLSLKYFTFDRIE